MTMRFELSCCPICEEEALGTLDGVPGLALLVFLDRGEAQYEGETRMDWDGQVTRRDTQGRVTLECPNGHQWQSEMYEVEETVPRGQCPVRGYRPESHAVPPNKR